MQLRPAADRTGDLQGLEFDLDLLGFDQDDLATLLDTGVKERLTDPDDVPAPPDEAVTQPGDLWVLGDHRLLCGEQTGRKAYLMELDPLYCDVIIKRFEDFTGRKAKRVGAGQKVLA